MSDLRSETYDTSVRQAARMALDALEVELGGYDGPVPHIDTAITALRAALAAPEQYAAQNPLGGPAKVFDAMADAIRAGDGYDETLRRYRFAEVKALAEPEQPTGKESLPVQGPVGQLQEEAYGRGQVMWFKKPADQSMLYTAPTPRKPLTDDEIALIVGECSASAYRHDDFSFARAIEAAHGIGEQT